MVIRVPWNEYAQEHYKSRIDAAKDVSFDGGHIVAEQANVDALHMTRKILAQECVPELPTDVTKVWALAAFPSLLAYQEDQAAASKSVLQEALAMVLTHRFFVPENEDKSDDELLAQAIKLARRDDLREKRAKFHRWQEDIIEQQIPPSEAVTEMEELLKQFEAVARKARIEVYWKFTFMAIPAAIGMATAGAGMQLVFASASGLVSVATFARFDRKPNIDAPPLDYPSTGFVLERRLTTVVLGLPFLHSAKRDPNGHFALLYLNICVNPKRQVTVSIVAPVANCKGDYLGQARSGCRNKQQIPTVCRRCLR